MNRTFPVRCFAQLFAINLLLLPGVVLAQSPGPSAEEQASYTQGLAAAKAGQYADAINKFTDVYTKDPKRSEVWLYLGLAQARTQGHEIRAIAWLQAYLLANPNAPNASAIQSQINLLEDSIESRIGRILDELEMAIPKGPLGESAPNASDLQVAFAGYDARSAGEQIAASRLFLGDTQQAVRVLNETNGRHWPNNSDNAFGSVASAFMSAPTVPVSSAVDGSKSSSDYSEFVLENADFPVAYSEVAAHWNTQEGWLALACAEHARGNSAAMPQILDHYWAAVQSYIKKNPNSDGYSDWYLVNAAANLILFQRNNEARTLIQNISKDAYKTEAAEYLSGSKTSDGCEDARFWWSSGRIAFLTYIGAHGIAPGSIQKVPYLDHEVFSQAYSQQEPALVSNTITVRMQAINLVSSQIVSLAEPYREVRGRYSPAIAAWPNETFQKGVDAEKRQQWTPALRFFLQSLEGDPKRPETLQHLGMVSAQIPGREYRAVAFLKAYLATVPNSDQRPQAEELITKVQQVIQSNLVEEVDALNHAIAADKTYHWCERADMAQEEALAGLGDRAMKTNKSKPRNPKICGGSVSAPLMIALALGGDVADARMAYAQNPPSFDGSDDDVLRHAIFFSNYDDLLGSYLHSGSIKDAEAVYSVMLKHSAVNGRSLPLLVCQEFRSGNGVAAADMLNNLRDTAVAGAKPTQQDDLAAFLGRIARMQVLMGDKKAAQTTLDQIKYPDKRKQQTDYAMAPHPEEGIDMARVFWLIFGNAYPAVFADLPAEECWFPETRANVLTDLAVGGFYIYANNGSGAGRCMETSPSECIEKAKQSDSSWDRWKSSVDALLTANDFLRSQ